MFLILYDTFKDFFFKQTLIRQTITIKQTVRIINFIKTIYNIAFLPSGYQKLMLVNPFPSFEL